MSDMLVKLYDLPPLAPLVERLAGEGVVIRRAEPWEKHAVVAWVGEHFHANWASECDVAFSNRPISCLLATHAGQVIGFGCYDATCKDYFGPTGVAEEFRGRRIGTALLLACLHAMRAEGYGYAIIGWVGPKAFYEKAVGATEIPDSTPGIYMDMLES
jgi:GNAT superfamily N-acetyltransferase